MKTIAIKSEKNWLGGYTYYIAGCWPVIINNKHYYPILGSYEKYSSVETMNEDPTIGKYLIHDNEYEMLFSGDRQLNALALQTIKVTNAKFARDADLENIMKKLTS